MDYGFTFINKKGVQARDGFIVQFTGRFSLEYRSGAFLMQCRVEPGMPCETIDVQPLPFGNLDAESRLEIVSRISSALDFMNVPHAIS